MGRKQNNKRNRRRAAFYGINPFDYEAREKLAAGQPPPEETSKKEEDVVKPGPGNEWTEAWTLKITVIQTIPRKAQANVFEHFKGLEVRTDLKDKRQ